jgi:formate-dependent nitrite reductase membrane component NrfD
VLYWRDFLQWIEGSALGNLIRDSGVWIYGAINLTHIIGIATLFGSIVVLDLRLLGRRRDVDLMRLASVITPVAATGFGIAAVSGICLLATNGGDYVGNPFLPIKFIAIALGLCNALVLGRLSGWQAKDTRELAPREHSHLSLAGGASLLCWLTAIGAGRMIGYW